jgi:hypothetical protein
MEGIYILELNWEKVQPKRQNPAGKEWKYTKKPMNSAK